jgi:hypothetical protein
MLLRTLADDLTSAASRKEIQEFDGCKKPRKASKRRGKASRFAHKPAGQALQQAGRDITRARQIRLGQQHLKKAPIHTTSQFSLAKDASAAKTGWHGRAPSLKGKSAITAAYNDGSIKSHLSQLHPVPFNE